MTYRLGTGIAQIIPFYRIEDTPIKQQDEPIISNKILYIFGIVAVIKICILLTF